MTDHPEYQQFLEYATKHPRVLRPCQGPDRPICDTCPLWGVKSGLDSADVIAILTGETYTPDTEPRYCAETLNTPAHKYQGYGGECKRCKLSKFHDIHRFPIYWQAKREHYGFGHR